MKVDGSIYKTAQTHRTMEQVVRAAWAWDTDISEIVVQDEYTHDVVVPLTEGWLVYDTT